jgi:hypothetical protein
LPSLIIRDGRTDLSSPQTKIELASVAALPLPLAT